MNFKKKLKNKKEKKRIISTRKRKKPYFDVPSVKVFVAKPYLSYSWLILTLALRQSVVHNTSGTENLYSHKVLLITMEQLLSGFRSLVERFFRLLL